MINLTKIDGPMRPLWVSSPQWGDEAWRSFKGVQRLLGATTLQLFLPQIISKLYASLLAYITRLEVSPN